MSLSEKVKRRKAKPWIRVSVLCHYQTFIFSFHFAFFRAQQCSNFKYCNGESHCCNAYYCCPNDRSCCYRPDLQCCKREPTFGKGNLETNMRRVMGISF